MESSAASGMRVPSTISTCCRHPQRKSGLCSTFTPGKMRNSDSENGDKRSPIVTLIYIDVNNTQRRQLYLPLNTVFLPKIRILHNMAVWFSQDAYNQPLEGTFPKYCTY